MSSKFIDNTSCLQIIGTVFNNLSLLDLTDKYNIIEDDFSENLHKITFGAIYKLHEKGADKINLENILDFLSTRPKSEAIFKRENGEDWLSKVITINNVDSFDYYYNRLKKFTLLRAYDNCGLDVSDIYDIDNILDTKKKQTQEEYLDNSSLEEIAETIEKKITDIRFSYVDNNWEEAIQAGEGLEELVEGFKKNPEIGSPLYGSLINSVTRGARLKKFYLRSAPTGVGKAIPNWITIPTPAGDRLVQNIEIGDFLFDENGIPTKVLAVYPQKELKKIWKLYLKDGRVAQCCDEHLWYYFINNKNEVNSLNVLFEKFKEQKEEDKFYLPLCQPVQYEEKEQQIHPYIMGNLLANQNLKYDYLDDAFIYGITEHDEILEKLCDLLNSNAFVLDNNKGYLIMNHNSLKSPSLISFLNSNQMILNNYLQGSVFQRISLLQGLMDAAGDIIEDKIYFMSDSEILLDNFTELCYSLGMSAKVDKENKRVEIFSCYDKIFDIFNILSKLEKFKQYLEKNEFYSTRIEIVDIEESSLHPVDMTCFTVENKEHLFLMNDYIVTHNTRSMIADACFIACNKFYDKRFGWIHNGVQEPVLFITTEQELSEIQTMLLAFLSGVNEEHIINGEYLDDEEERIFEAINILKESPLYVEELPDFSLKDVEDKIKKNIRDHDIKYVFHDYIHTSLKILEEITKRSGGVKLREDNILFMLSTKLKDICNKYGIFIMSATQLSGDYSGAETPD
jgi:replicative DNA helicase